MKKPIIALLSLFCMLFAGILPLYSTISAENLSETRAFVKETAVVLWSDPEKTPPRLSDNDILKSPSNTEAWVKSMKTTDDKLWLSKNSALETQATLGTEVTILERKTITGSDGIARRWVKVAVHSHRNPKDEAHRNGYPGWVLESQLAEYNQKQEYYNPTKKFVEHYDNPNGLFIVVKEPQTMISDRAFPVYYNTRLPVLSHDDISCQVILPSGNIGKVQKKDVRIYPKSGQPAGTVEDIIADLKKLLGIPYIWAGTGGGGFDCSGLVNAVHDANGIKTPRDSRPISEAGTYVSKDQLQPGDVLYFAHTEGPKKGRVHHVGIYIGNDQMIHAPGAESAVETITLTGSLYEQKLVGGRRFLVSQ